MEVDEAAWNAVGKVWAANRWKWERKTQIPQLNGSWLSFSQETWCLGCLVCKMGKKNNEYGNFEVITTNFSNIKRHETCKDHVQALADFGLVEGQGENDDSPALKAFEQVWTGRMRGPLALRHGESDVGGRKKVTCMMQCIGNAMFELDRRFLRTAESITLHMDVRKAKLLVRYRAANRKLDSRRGILGIADLQRSTASDLSAAVKGILQQFCHGLEGLDQELLDHLVHHIEILDADAASDEQCSSRELRKTLLRQVKCILKDKAHASRRILSRPWKVVPGLHDAFDTFVSDSSSITRVIQNSSVLSSVFNQHCQRVESSVNGKRIKNLSFKKQRFDSVAKPLGRGILWLRPVLETAIWATIHRRGDKECACAEAFLEWVSEERLVMVGMAADAADAALGLVRAFDTESYDPSLMTLECEKFLSELHYLFNQGLKHGDSK